jgi:hypothetical protein
MINELKAGGYLTPDGKTIPLEISEAQSKEVNAIMDRYETVTAR